MEVLVTSAESLDNGSADLEGSAGNITTNGQMAVVVLGLGICIRSHNVSDNLVSTRCLSNDLVVIDDKLVSAGGERVTRDLLDLSIQRDGGLGGKSQGIVGLGEDVAEDTLEESRTVAQSDEDHVLLRAQAVNPSGDLDAVTTVGSGVSDLDLPCEGLGAILDKDDASASLEHGFARGANLSIFCSLLKLLGLLLDVRLVTVGRLLQRSFGDGFVLSTSLHGQAGERLAGLELGAGGGLAGVDQGGEQSLERKLLGAGSLGGIDSGILVDVDDYRGQYATLIDTDTCPPLVSEIERSLAEGTVESAILRCGALCSPSGEFC